MTSNDYWESNILGHPRLPEGVKFLIGNFPLMFGTDDGRSLQKVSEHYSWPLVWAFGYGQASSKSSSTVAGNKRILDPTDAAANTNATLPNSAANNFEDVWSLVETARKSQTNPSASDFSRWWSSLEESQVRMAPLAHDSCADTDCVGIAIGSNDCICKSAAITTVVA